MQPTLVWSGLTGLGSRGQGFIAGSGLYFWGGLEADVAAIPGLAALRLGTSDMPVCMSAPPYIETLNPESE